jgi:signal transduction histidine kinase
MRCGGASTTIDALGYCVDMSATTLARADHHDTATRLSLVTRQLEDEQRLRLLESERTRIAQELYDHAEQAFFAIGLLASAALSEARANAAPAAATEVLARVSELALTGTQHLRDARNALNGADAVEREVVPALRQIVIAFQFRTGIEADLLLSSKPRRVPAEVAETIESIARTTLTYIEAVPRASAVVVRLKLDSRAIWLSIHDDGATSTRTRIVDSSMRELAKQVRRLGGAFSARAASEGGLLVRTRLPINRSSS